MSFGKQAADTTNAASGNRVITYLPPPAEDQKSKEESVLKPASSWTIKRAQVDQIPVLSEPQRNLKTTDLNSEPDSDVTLVPSSSPLDKKGPEKTISLSVEKLSDSYPQLRKEIKEVTDYSFG